MKILLAVDGSAYTQKMLDYLTSHAGLATGQNSFTVLTVQAALPARARAALAKDLVDSYYAEEATKVLEPICQFLEKHQIKAECCAEIGSAGEVIARIAESGGYDLLVMGSHGHGALGRLVMGSVSTQVLANCSVPVLLIR